MAFEASDCWIVCGLGALWLGAQILWAGHLPRALRRGPQPSAPRGTPEAFALFWRNQYGALGLALAFGGALAALRGWLA